MTGQIHLTEEKETLFITLSAKASDYRSKHSILHDKEADDILKKISNDFTKYKGFGDKIMVVRAKQFDEWIQAFIKENKNAVVLYLGCGLDTRINRIDPSSFINWFDVDYPEVIELRKIFYSDRDGYQMIASSVIEPGWLKQIPHDQPTLIIAEGLLEYLTGEEVKALFSRLTDHFNHGHMLFDVMNSFAIQAGRKQLKAITGAVHKWAVDDTKELDRLNPRLTRIKELPLFKSKYMRKLPLGLRLFVSLASFIPRYKNMLRLMHYQF
jgi:O-methyltransferase involved in polyketide biosynthesis